MSLAPLTEGQFHSLRSLYMNVYIRPGQATLPLAVLVNGKLVGVYAFSTAPHVGAFAERTLESLWARPSQGGAIGRSW